MLSALSFVFSLVAGLILLLSGRRLFWLFVASLGFAVGFGLAKLIIGNQPGFLLLAIALGVGLLGAWLAVHLQKAALAIAGFGAGGYVLSFLFQAGGMDLPEILLWFAGGVVGAILLVVLFDWALVFLSAASGAALLAHTIPLLDNFLLLKFVALFITGFVIQAVNLSQSRKQR